MRGISSLTPLVLALTSTLVAGCNFSNGEDDDTSGVDTPVPATPTDPPPTEPALETPEPTPEPTEENDRTPFPTRVPTPIPEPPTQGPVGPAQVDDPQGLDEVTVEKRVIPAEMRPAPNPTGGPNDVGSTATPGSLMNISYLRYAYTGSTRDVEVILVAEPGFAGGAGSFDYIGRTLVAEGQGRIEVWAIERRSNLLEDDAGTTAAEASLDIQTGLSYYFGRASINGQSFKGFVTDPDVPYMSEWGLRMAVWDMNTVIKQVPAEKRNQVVFLAGHSMGGSIAQAYAAFDFDEDAGTMEDAGFNQIAGMILLDGGSDPAPATSQRTYERDVQSIRAGARITSFPGMTPDVHALLDLFGMQAVHGATDEAPIAQILATDGVNAAFLSTLFGTARFTNRGALGVSLDDNFQQAYVEQASVGFLTGGPVDTTTVNDATFYKPGDQTGTVIYGWLPYTTSDLPVANASVEEMTNIDDLAYGLHLGPANFTEWYFPARLSTDLAVVSDLAVTVPRAAGEELDWRAATYGLWVVHNTRVNIPIVGFFGGDEDNANSEETLVDYKASINPILRDGSSRSNGGFNMQICGGYEHIDVLFADADNGSRPSIPLSTLPGWFEDWGLYQSGTGIPLSDLPVSVSTP